MKRTEFIIAISLLTVAVGVVVKNGFWHEPRPAEIVANASTAKAGADPDKAARLALLKKYSKRGPNYVAEQPADPGASADSTDQAADTAAPMYDASPIPPPTAPAAAPRATVTAPPAETPADEDSNQSVQPEVSSATPPVPYDDYTRAVAESQLSDPYNATDQQLLDGMMGMLTPDQQNVFQNMWASMTVDEQRQWMADFRNMLSP